MNADEYRSMRVQEDSHWWYAALRAAVLRHVEACLNGHSVRVLDAGCGTGGMLAALRERFPSAELTGIDLNEQAVQLTAARQVADQLVRGSVNALPLGSGAFDAAVFLDVLYHAAVQEDAALSEMERVLRPGGVLIVNVPAFEALRGAHDIAVHGCRRYTPHMLAELAARNRLRLERWTCWNMMLCPVLWAWRRIGRVVGSEASDVRPVPVWLNRVLERVLRVEWRIADRAVLPFGSSLFAILRKPSSS